MNFDILEPDGESANLVSQNAVDWEPANDWMHIACTYEYDDVGESWELNMLVDGQVISTSASGNASTSSALGDYMYLGSSYDQDNFSDGKFDDFFICDIEKDEDEVSKIYDSPIQISEGILRATLGSDTTDASIGIEKAVSHGLGEIPSFIEITEKGAGVVYLSNDSTNQYFYVKSTASSVDFDWRAWK